MRSAVFSILAVICLSSLVAAKPIQTCRNTNDDSFFNKCRMEAPPGAWAALGTTTTGWVNPTILAVTSCWVLLLLPFAVVHTRANKQNLAQFVVFFRRAHLMVLHVLHTATYTLALNVALYAIFRQRRPCQCSVDGIVWSQQGSIYGMPSGDALSGGVVAAWLVLWEPFGLKWTSRALAVIVVFLKCAERLALGFHSVGQVVTGSTLGIVLTVYTNKMPQYFIVIDVFIQWLLGVIALPIDHELQYSADDGLNITAWYFWAAVLCCFSLGLTLRFYYLRSWVGFRLPLAKALETLGSDSVLRQPLLSGPDGVEVSRVQDATYIDSPDIQTPSEAPTAAKDSQGAWMQYLRDLTDLKVTYGAFAAFYFAQWIVYMFQTYGWGYA